MTKSDATKMNARASFWYGVGEAGVLFAIVMFILWLTGVVRA